MIVYICYEYDYETDWVVKLVSSKEQAVVFMKTALEEGVEGRFYDQFILDEDV